MKGMAETRHEDCGDGYCPFFITSLIPGSLHIGFRLVHMPSPTGGRPSKLLPTDGGLYLLSPLD